MAEITLDAVKRYCNIDHNEDDALILTLMDSAAAYLKDAGIGDEAKEDPRYALCVYGIVLKWYDQRDVETIGTITSPAEFGIRRVFNQLKFKYGW